MNACNDTVNGQYTVENRYVVVHPCFDAPEEKLDVNRLGPMKMTRAVRWSLWSLRAYLVVMVLLSAYKFIDMSGMLEHLTG